MNLDVTFRLSSQMNDAILLEKVQINYCLVITDKAAIDDARRLRFVIF